MTSIFILAEIERFKYINIQLLSEVRKMDVKMDVKELEKKYGGKVGIAETGREYKIFVAAIPVLDIPGPVLVVVGEVNSKGEVNEYAVHRK